MSLDPLPTSGVAEKVSQVSDDQENARTSTPDVFSILGTRSDLTAGRGVRYRHGILPEGFFGTETFSSDGKRCRNGKWAGEIFFFSGATPPEGCDEADGATVDPTTADEKYLYLARGMGVSETATFAKPNARGRVLVGKAASGTFVTLRATGGAETASDAVNVSGSVTLTTANLPPHSHPLTDPGHFHTTPANMSSSGAVYWAGGANGSAVSQNTDSKLTGITIGDTGSGTSFSTGGSDTVVVSTLQPYLILLACVAL